MSSCCRADSHIPQYTLRAVFAVGMLASVATTAPAEDKPGPEDQSPWVELAKTQAAEHTLSPTSDPERPFTLRPEPVLHHVQNVRGNAVGSVFVWLEASGRPAAVCDVFFLPSRDRYAMYNEWHSLTSSPLTARWQGSTVWSPDGPGLEWKPIPNSGTPAESPAQRNRQIRQLSRRFAAHIINRSDDRYELRMLPTPLLRYDTMPADESLGGALFAFCQDTVPEVLLLIEARKTADGYQWQFAPAEFSNMSQFLHLDGDEVWKADPPTFNHSGPHTARIPKTVEIPQRAEE